jgi:hypothetical protein
MIKFILNYKNFKNLMLLNFWLIRALDEMIIHIWPKLSRPYWFDKISDMNPP